MAFPRILIVVVALIHVFAAVMWIGGNFFELMTLAPGLRKNSQLVQEEVATTVPLNEHKNSAIFATTTIIAGPILAYLYANGNMSLYVKTGSGMSILAGGLIALFLYIIGWYAGSLRVKIAEATKSALMMPSGDQAVSARSSIASLNSKLKRMIYLENALGALVLFFMVLAGSLT